MSSVLDAASTIVAGGMIGAAAWAAKAVCSGSSNVKAAK